MNSRFSANACQQCANAANCFLPHTIKSTISLEAFQFPAYLLKQGERLRCQNNPSNSLYILRAGVLKSYITKSNGEEFVMGFYFPPDLFGWEYMDKTHHTISVVALHQCNICVISTEKLFTFTKQIPQIGAQLLRMVSRRIEQDNVALLHTTAHQRVATFLLQLAYRYRQMGFTDHYCQLHMTHQDIANYLRMNPSTISRIFHEWQNKKIIRIEKNQVYLLDWMAIRDMTEQ